MPVKVQCPAGHQMMVPDHRAGTVLRCPNCGIDVQVPGEAQGAAKSLGKPKLQTPAIQRPSLSIPAISGAGEQSPHVAGHSTAAKSGIGKLNPRALAKSRAKPSPAPVPSPAQEVSNSLPAQFEPTIALKAELPLPPVVPAPAEIKPPPPTSKPEPAFTPEIAFAEVQQHDPPRATRLPSRAEVPESKRTTVDAPTKPASNRPRTTLTGTVLAPAQSVEQPSASEPTPPPVTAPLIATAAVSPAVPLVEPPLAEPPTVVESHESNSPPSESTPLTVAFHAAATLVEDNIPHAHAPPVVVTLGPQPTASQRVTVWQLAAALFAALLFSIGPSLWEIGDYLRSDGEQTAARWAFFLLVLGVVQFGTLVLLIQVPDWSSVWIVTLQSLALAGLYAAILGLTVITGGDSTLIGALGLDHQYNTGKAPMWCVCLAATYACLALFAGRFSAKWHKVLKQMRATDEAAYAH